MKKFTVLLGVGVGFVLGSRAGSQPYEQLEAAVRKVANRSATKLPSSSKAKVPPGDADHPGIDPENVAGAGEDAADRGITGLEV